MCVCSCAYVHVRMFMSVCVCVCVGECSREFVFPFFCTLFKKLCELIMMGVFVLESHCFVNALKLVYISFTQISVAEPNETASPAVWV